MNALQLLQCEQRSCTPSSRLKLTATLDTWRSVALGGAYLYERTEATEGQREHRDNPGVARRRCARLDKVKAFADDGGAAPCDRGMRAATANRPHIRAASAGC